MKKALALILALLIPGLSAAQSVAITAAASGSAATAASASAAARAVTPMPLAATSILPTSLSLSRSLLPSSLTAPLARVAAPSAAQATPVATASVQTSPVERGALSTLVEGARSDAQTPSAVSVTPASLIFDGAQARRSIADDAVSAANAPQHPTSQLIRKVATSSHKSTAVLPLPARTPSSGGRSGVNAALLTGALLLAFPALALAVGAPVAAGFSSLAFLATIHPLVSAVAAAAGAVYGLIASRRKDGTPASSGETLTSMLRYGMLAGAGVYVLLDMTQVLFSGLSAVGLSPLSSAVATAALGQSAFQGTFKDPATSPADRIMGAFPAVAAALGLSVGGLMLLDAPTLLFTTAVTAMSATGVAAAVYAALYTPAKSPEKGPTDMARGYVLQALMTGLALALTNPYLVAAFMALGAWGFWDVIATTLREIYSRVR